MFPRISIIVPVYNVQDLLPRCVKSLVNQTFKDIEILLIDDGSEDNSGNLCDVFSKSDDRISVYHKKNGGLSDARNYGMNHAKGQFYLFIDSDDVIHKDFCKKLIELQEKYNSEITSTEIALFYDSNEIETFNKKVFIGKESVFYGTDILKEYYIPHDSRRIYHGLCMKMYKKELFSDLQFERGRLHEDLFITYKLLDKCNIFAYIDLPYYYYYQSNSNSITKNYKEKNLLDEYDALINMEKYFSKEEYRDVKKYLYTFIVYHLHYLLYQSYNLKSTRVIKNKKKVIKKDIIAYIKKTNLIPRKKYLYLLLEVNIFYFARFLLKIVHVIKNVKQIHK